MIRRLATFLLGMLAAYGAMVVPFLLSDDPRVAFATLAVAAPFVTLIARRRVEAARGRPEPSRQGAAPTKQRPTPSAEDASA